MSTPYEKDVVAWATEQAALLRAGNLLAIDVRNIAEELECLARTEQSVLTTLMSGLMSKLLKWHYQPLQRGASLEKSIKANRIEMEFTIKEAPSLNNRLSDNDWLNLAWAKAVAKAIEDTGLNGFPDAMMWTMSDIRNSEFLPDSV